MSFLAIPCRASHAEIDQHNAALDSSTQRDLKSPLAGRVAGALDDLGNTISAVRGLAGVACANQAAERMARFPVK